MMAGLAAERGERKSVTIDATYLQAHRRSTSMGRWALPESQFGCVAASYFGSQMDFVNQCLARLARRSFRPLN
jgi:hypothetical protein